MEEVLVYLLVTQYLGDLFFGGAAAHGSGHQFHSQYPHMFEELSGRFFLVWPEIGRKFFL